MTKQTTVMMDGKTRTQLDDIAQRDGSTKKAAISRAIAREHAAQERGCGCTGDGHIAWHEGSRVYCKCWLGVTLQLADISKELMNASEVLVALDEADIDGPERGLIKWHFDTLTLKHDSLERELERLLSR